MRRCNVNLRVFRCGISIDVCNNEEFEKINGFSNAVATTHCCQSYNPRIVLKRNSISIGTLFHEILHALRHDLIEKRGFDYLDRWDDETLPYCAQYVVNEFLKWSVRNKIKVDLVSKDI